MYPLKKNAPVRYILYTLQGRKKWQLNSIVVRHVNRLKSGAKGGIAGHSQSGGREKESAGGKAIRRHFLWDCKRHRKFGDVAGYRHGRGDTSCPCNSSTSRWVMVSGRLSWCEPEPAGMVAGGHCLSCLPFRYRICVMIFPPPAESRKLAACHAGLATVPRTAPGKAP